MKVKYLLIAILSISFEIYAQDLLVTMDNDSINCEIIEVYDKEIQLKVYKGHRWVDSNMPMERISDYKIGFYNQKISKTSSSDSSQYFLVETNDGNIYIGRVTKTTPETISLETKNIGEVTLKLVNIESLQPLEDGNTDPTNVRWSDYLQSSRYFFSPSGYGLRKGDAYYQNVWLLFNQFSMGFSDHFSAGIGLIPLFLFAGAASPVWLTPKFSIPVVKDKFNVGVGALTGAVFGAFWEDSAFGIVYGMATLGSRNRNLSVGLGYGYAADEFSRRPSISLSGMLKVGKKGYLVTESYIFDEFGLISIGGRSLIKSVTLDYGLVMPANAGVFIGIPWLGLVIPIETGLGK